MARDPDAPQIEEYCPNCGQYTEGELICPNCGAMLGEEEDEFEGFQDDDGDDDLEDKV